MDFKSLSRVYVDLCLPTKDLDTLDTTKAYAREEKKVMARLHEWTDRLRQLPREKTSAPIANPGLYYYRDPQDQDDVMSVFEFEWMQYVRAITVDPNVVKWYNQPGHQKYNMETDLGTVCRAGNWTTNPLWRLTTPQTKIALHIPILGIVNTSVIQTRIRSLAVQSTREELNTTLYDYYTTYCRWVEYKMALSAITTPVVVVIDHSTTTPPSPPPSRTTIDFPIPSIENSKTWNPSPDITKLFNVLNTERTHYLTSRSHTATWNERDHPLLEKEIEAGQSAAIQRTRESRHGWIAEVRVLRRVLLSLQRITTLHQSAKKTRQFIEVIRSQVQHPALRSLVPVSLSDSVDTAVQDAVIHEIRLQTRMSDDDHRVSAERRHASAWSKYIHEFIQLAFWNHLDRMHHHVVHLRTDDCTFSRLECVQSIERIEPAEESAHGSNSEDDDKEDKPNAAVIQQWNVWRNDTFINEMKSIQQKMEGYERCIESLVQIHAHVGASNRSLLETFMRDNEDIFRSHQTDLTLQQIINTKFNLRELYYELKQPNITWKKWYKYIFIFVIGFVLVNKNKCF